MENFVIVLVLLVVIGGAVAYIIKEKKRGVKCIGCSSGGKCSCGSCGGNCEGHHENHTDMK